MKHIVILNGRAGEGTAINYVNNIEKAFKGLDCEIHYTTAPGEATEYLKEELAKINEPTRVYACGGDGTLNECLNGVYGFDNVELAVYSIGTGNDFVKIYGGKEKFLNLENIINGEATEIDISEITSPELPRPIYSLNAVNVGFDAMVGYYGNIYKEKGKKDPYDKAIVPCLLKHRFNKIKVLVDGEKITNKSKILMANFCHGQYIGGKFHAAPKSVNTDGLIDVCLVNTCSIFTFLKILKPFTDGEHFNGKFDKIFKYKQAQEIEISSPKTISICVDGEMYPGKTFKMKSLPKAVKFILPKE